MGKAFQSFILGMAGILAIGCGSTAPSTPKSGGGGTATFSYPFVRAFGVGGSGDNGTFKDGPEGIAIGLGAIYIGDSDYSAVDKFDLNGNYLGQSVYGADQNLGGMACDKDGNVYVTNFKNGSVDKFDQNLNFIHSFTGGQFGVHQNFGGPYGVTVDSSLNLYVADYDNDVVYKVDQTDTINVTSSGTLSLDGPYGVILGSNGAVYVADTGDSRVVALNSSLVSTGSFDGSNGGTAFSEPSGLAMDSQGNLIVADLDTDTVQSFTTSGTFLKAIGNTSASVIWDYPYFLAIDPGTGDLYVPNYRGGSIAIFNP